MSEEWVETRCCRQRLRPDGILAMRYKRGADHTLADAKEEVAALAQMLGDRGPAPLLVVLGAVRSQEHAAREYLTSSEEVAAIVSRAALVISTPVSRVIATLFTRLRRPRLDVRVFGDEASALEWLRGEGESIPRG